MDDKSTPIESLNNKKDESEVVNQILQKYNHLNEDMSSLEQNFENRNVNKEMFELNTNDAPYKEHYQNEMQRVHKYNNRSSPPEDIYEEEYEEFEVIELPLWKRILNEIRIPFFIFVILLIMNNAMIDKIILGKLTFLGNAFHEYNIYGVLFKAFFISLFSYVCILFLKFRSE